MSESKSNIARNFKLTDQLVARFTVCVDTDVFNRLTSLARRRNLARSELVRDIITEYLTLVSPPKRSRQEHVDA